ncbi:MAG: VIT and VWA domain-containing protein [Acidobacteriota bacterium]
MKSLAMLPFILSLSLPLTSSPSATARPQRELAGSFEAEVEGRRLTLPLVSSLVDARGRGDLWTVTLRQVFENPTDQMLNATYVFPLDNRAALQAMTVHAGDEVLTTRIEETSTAERRYEEAKAQGRQAALVRQHRPNVFTQQVAHLPPGEAIEVELVYVTTARRDEGRYELVLPTVVGPRHGRFSDGPPAAARGGDDGGAANGSLAWQLQGPVPTAPTAEDGLPESVDSGRVDLVLSLDGGMPIEEAFSPSHELEVHSDGSELAARFRDGAVIGNRDVVFRYRLAGDDVQAGVFAHRDELGGTVSLLLEAPEEPPEEQVTPREVVFVVDTSGSMEGQALAACQALMQRCLEELRPTDTFRIVRFADDSTEMSQRVQPAQRTEIALASQYIDSLRANGGTDMEVGLKRAMGSPVRPGFLRLVVLLTDGYIGNEQAVLGLSAELLGDARLHALGVSDSPNRYLLDELAQRGRGTVAYLSSTDDIDEVTAGLARRLKSPLLTDVQVDWSELGITEVYPDPLPDLFAGQAIRISGRYDEARSGKVEVEGLVRGERVVLSLPVELPEKGGDGGIVTTCWARDAIAHGLRELSLPFRDRPSGRGDHVIREDVTRLGLDHSLVTPWTSFVATSDRVVTQEPEKTVDAAVPVPTPHSPRRNPGPRPTPSAFRLNGPPASPEPATMVGLTMLGGATAAALRKRRREDED